MTQWLYVGLLDSQRPWKAAESGYRNDMRPVADCLPPVSWFGYQLVIRQLLLLFHLYLIYDLYLISFLIITLSDDTVVVWRVTR